MSDKMLSQFPFDRRKEKRIPIVVSVIERNSSGKIICLATDISFSGMALKRAGDSLHENRVVLEFSLPGIGDVLKIPSTLIRVDENEGTKQQSVAVFDCVPSYLKEWIDTFSRFSGIAYMT
ncbi:MAG: PilZ domain-containing protein [Deltaproteobacteria bacterium]|nr:PilZ domain-containing protein [Deltaproteobacteria bacterium]